MDEEAMFESLLNAEVVRETADGGIRVTNQFERDVHKREMMLRGADVEAVADELRSAGTPDDSVARLVGIAEFDPRFLAQYLVVRQAIDNIAFESTVRVTVLIDHLEGPARPTAGSPNPFFPVQGEKLPTLLEIFPVAVVYVWREESSECDRMKQTLENQLEDPPENVSLFSVYGPDCAAFLDKEYDIVGGPTTLFVVDGRVDSRLLGAQYLEVVREEIDEVRKTAEARGFL